MGFYNGLTIQVLEDFSKADSSVGALLNLV